MGVDTLIRLSPQTSIKDVATALSILLGEPWDCDDIGYNDRSIISTRGSAKTTSAGFVECAWITGDKFSVFYHFESPNGSRMMSPYMSERWIAVGVALVDFFGGSVDFNDCDDTETDYENVCYWPTTPQDDEDWNDFHRALASLSLVRIGP